MSLKNYGQDEIEDLSMIELAKKMLLEENKATDFRELYNTITEMKGYSEEQKENYIAQFYTDLNIDGSFLTVGSNLWGLKRWYPVEQIDEDIAAPKKKKKKKKKAATKKPKKEEVFAEPEEEDLDLDEEELDFDDTDFDDADLEDDTLADDDFDDFDDDDEDEEYDDADDSTDDNSDEHEEK